MDIAGQRQEQIPYGNDKQGGSMHPPRSGFRLELRKHDFDGRVSVNGRQHPRGLGDGSEV